MADKSEKCAFKLGETSALIAGASISLMRAQSGLMLLCEML